MQPVRVGDILEIPLKDGRLAYAQYVHWDAAQGPLLQVFRVWRRVPLATWRPRRRCSGP